MNPMPWLPALVDAVIAFTLLEGAALVIWHHVSGRGVAPRDFALNMVSGLALMLALRCGVRDAGAPWVAGWLLAAGLAHAADLLLRGSRSRRAALLSGGVVA